MESPLIRLPAKNSKKLPTARVLQVWDEQESEMSRLRST